MNVYILKCVDKRGVRERAEKTQLLAVLMYKKKNENTLRIDSYIQICV